MLVIFCYFKVLYKLGNLCINIFLLYINYLPIIMFDQGGALHRGIRIDKIGENVLLLLLYDVAVILDNKISISILIPYSIYI